MKLKAGLFLMMFIFLIDLANGGTATETNEVIRAAKTDTPIVVDGVMEDVWNRSALYSNFLQLDPFPFEQPSQKTEFRILYDEKNLFFYIKAFDDPQKITTVQGKRDINQNLTDWLKIYVDPLNNKTSGYSFTVNPSNVQNDSRIYNGGVSRDLKWDGIWESAVKLADDGWIAEVKIPVNILKFQDKKTQDWGINIARYIFREQQQSNFMIKDANAGYLITNYARLTDLENLKPASNLVITPSVTGNFDSNQDYDPTKNNRTFGADLRYDLNPENTLMVTIIPDFAQIEADPDVINISDYPVYLREKRPFFLEGDDLFHTYDDLYYSRRMARPKAGTKFLGSTKDFDYGLMYVKNEAVSDSLNHLEDFVIARLKYGNQNFKIGYLGGYTDSKYDLSGQLHNLDLRYQATNSLEFRALAATTLIKGKDKKNGSWRLQFRYDRENWRFSVRYQKKTSGFEQGLIGYPETNNTTESMVHYQRRMKFKESIFTRFRWNIGLIYKSLYNNEVDRTRYFFNFHATMDIPSFGLLYLGSALDRYLGYNRYYVSDGIYSDNYGNFNPIENDHFYHMFYVETDPSKPVKVFARFVKRLIKKADTKHYRFHLTYKINASFSTTLSYDLYDIARSEFLDEEDSGHLSTFSLKTEYAISENIFLKMYNQYNSQYDRLSNNLVISYEYLRGNFVYLAYADTGIFEDIDREKSFVEKYKLDRRTISLKWSYALYL